VMSRARTLSHHRGEDGGRRSGQCRPRAGAAGFTVLRRGPRVGDEAGPRLGRVENRKGGGERRGRLHRTQILAGFRPVAK
jgi:hypothetical protein